MYIAYWLQVAGAWSLLTGCRSSLSHSVFYIWTVQMDNTYRTKSNWTKIHLNIATKNRTNKNVDRQWNYVISTQFILFCVFESRNQLKFIQLAVQWDTNTHTRDKWVHALAVIVRSIMITYEKSSAPVVATPTRNHTHTWHKHIFWLIVLVDTLRNGHQFST